MAIVEGENGRVTIGSLRDDYGVRIGSSALEHVSITSIARRFDEITPGSIYIPQRDEWDVDHYSRASGRGAYAILIPPEQDERIGIATPDIPVVEAVNFEKDLGALASQIEGEPSMALAVFIVFGHGCSRVNEQLAKMLHMLGNPVGVIDSKASPRTALKEDVRTTMPLDACGLQRLLGVFLEDGVSAVVISGDEQTLQPMALVGVHADICAITTEDDTLDAFTLRYGFKPSESTLVASRDSQSDSIASRIGFGLLADISLAVAMALKAGVTEQSISSAFKITSEMTGSK
jgi:hypothetical protein